MNAELQAAQSHHGQAMAMGLAPLSVLALILKYGPSVVHVIADIVAMIGKQQAATPPTAPVVASA